MSDKTLLLATLSRALHDTEDAIDWLWDTFQWHIKQIAPSVVINGGAERGDRDATKIAIALGINCCEYRTDGWLYVRDGNDLCRAHRWWDSVGSVHPLERNRFMVSRCVRYRDQGWNVRVLGLIAPWSKTHGTSHTLAQAAHFGLEVTRLECPRDYAPEASQ